MTVNNLGLAAVDLRASVSQGFHMYAWEENVEISAFVGAALQRAGVCLSEQWQRGMNQAFDHPQLSDH